MTETAPIGFEWAALLLGVAAVPLAVVVTTCFVKVTVVFAILRSALGISGVPSGLVIVGFGVVLSAFVMAPVGEEMHAEALAAWSEAALSAEPARAEMWSAAASASLEPLTRFLGRHAHPDETELFVELSGGRGSGTALSADDPMVLVPAFLVSELEEAFVVGFLIFVPFLVLDLFIANLLLSLGMHMLPPRAISLPFKLLLFVLVDGWTLLVGGLVQSYQII